MLSRRTLIQGSLALGAMQGLAACKTGQAAGAMIGSADAPIGIQLYALGDLPQKDLDGTLSQLASIGYRKVELPGFLGKSPGDIRSALDRAGLACSSVHVALSGGSEAFPDLSGDIAKVADQVAAVGARYVVAPMFKLPPGVQLATLPGEDLPAALKRIAASMTEDQWKRMAELLNTAGEAIKRHGLQFGYHNHNVEFAPHGGKTGWDTIIAETDPDLVVFELDVGWVSAAGLDPAQLLLRDRGRYRLMHVKDLKPSTKPNFALSMDPTEVGSGRIDWMAVMNAARDAGVREYFVEQEPPFERDRLEAARISFNYLSALTGT